MHRYRLEREQWLDHSLPAVFDFFSRAENLGAITPPWLRFRFRTPLPVDMARDARIEYTLTLGGVPLRWRTRITVWEPERRFVDVQESGPYALWEHHHLFEEKSGGVLMRDRVDYALPLGRLGRLVHFLAIRPLLSAIFDYRFQHVPALLADASRTPPRMIPDAN